MALLHDTIQAAGAVTAAIANKVDLGDITLGAGQWTITRAWAMVMHAGTITAAMGLSGYIRITSEDCDIAPFEFPLEPVAGPLGTGELEAPIPEPRKYVINCKAKGGTVLHVHHIADQTITTVLSETIVTVEYTAGSSPFPGGQLHMTCGEPAVTGSTSDGGVVSLTDIGIKAKILRAVIVYIATTTAVASTGHMLMFEMTSDDFAQKGPQRWALNPQRAGGVASNSSGQISKTLLVEVDMPFGSPGQKQTISAEITAYDAVTTGPTVNWCLIWN